jgi:hypothetical protein
MSYSALDQAADLGIHRVHSLVLGDPQKEARIARAAHFVTPTPRKPTLGKGDVRFEEHQYERETKRELDKIARRNNLKTYDPWTRTRENGGVRWVADFRDDNGRKGDGESLTDLIAAWGCNTLPPVVIGMLMIALKVENAIARPDGLGTGNAHRAGPNYHPVATVLPP